MKLSEAIERGIPFVPGGAHSYFRFVGATPHDYAERVAHHKPLHSADALGTAIVGMAGDPVRAAQDSYADPYFGPHTLITHLYPELKDRVACPVCHNPRAIDLTPMTIVKMVWHVQDTHGWTREEVAAWLKRAGH
jgi:hypothetical protein